MKQAADHVASQPGTVVHDGSRAALVDRRIVYAFDARKPAPGAPSFAEAYNISADGSRAMFWSARLLPRERHS